MTTPIRPSLSATLSIASDPQNPHFDKLGQRAEVLAGLIEAMGQHVSAFDGMKEDLNHQIDTLNLDTLNPLKKAARLMALSQVEGTRDDPFDCYELAEKIARVQDSRVREELDACETAIFTRLVADVFTKHPGADAEVVEAMEELRHINGRDFDNSHGDGGFPFAALDEQLKLQFLASHPIHAV